MHCTQVWSGQRSETSYTQLVKLVEEPTKAGQDSRTQRITPNPS